MEYGPEHLPPRREMFRSFDVMASIDMLRFDLIANGHIRPETKQRVYDEELTFVAENLNRPMYTTFALRAEANQLLYFDRGQWQPYIGMLMQGLKTAQAEAQQDYRRAFLVERAAYDLEIGYRLKALQPGEKLFWHSPFPEQEFYQFGGEFLRQAGFQVDRWMGFMYHAEKQADGTVMLEAHSVDNSEPEAFEAAQAYSLIHPEIGLPQLVSVYDAVLSQKYEESFRAGRPIADEVEAWQFIRSQIDLVEHYMHRLEELASQDVRTEQLKKELTYGFWAALKDRLKTVTDNQPIKLRGYDDPLTQSHLLDLEMNQSLQRAIIRHERMVGCGGILSLNGPEPSAGLLDLEPQDAMDSIMGDKSEKLVWKSGVCRIEGCPTRPNKTQVAQCSVCKKCQALFDKGADPTKLYSRSVKPAYN